MLRAILDRFHLSRSTHLPAIHSHHTHNPRQAYKYAIFEGGHFKRWEALDIPRVVCIEEFHAQLDDVLDQVINQLIIHAHTVSQGPVQSHISSLAPSHALPFHPQVDPEDADTGAPGQQQAKREVINRIRRTLSETLECK